MLKIEKLLRDLIEDKGVVKVSDIKSILPKWKKKKLAGTYWISAMTCTKNPLFYDGWFYVNKKRIYVVGYFVVDKGKKIFCYIETKELFYQEADNG